MSARGTALAASLALCSCTLLPVGGRVTASPGGFVSPAAPALREYRAAFHTHCYLSHDSEGSIANIASAASELGFNVVILNDHYEPGNVARAPRGVHYGVLFIPGVEIPHEDGSSLLAIAPPSDFPLELSFEQTAAHLRDGGALLVAGHVESLGPDRDLDGFEGFEVYNLHTEFLQTAPWRIILRFVFLTPDFFFEVALRDRTAQLARWDEEQRQRPLVALAGHDAHANIHVLGPLGGTVGTYAQVFRLFSNRILARELTEKAILDGIRRGHVHIAFDCVADPRGFVARYGSGDRGWALPGDEAPLAAAAQLEIRLPLVGKILLLRDGAVIAETTGRWLTTALPGPGQYRVEVHRNHHLWIATNALRVTDV